MLVMSVILLVVGMGAALAYTRYLLDELGQPGPG
jgi:hypothetical protein